MTLYEYNVLNLADRANVLWSEGNFITNVNLGNKKYSLYSLFDFFTEVEVETNDEPPAIMRITTFKRGEKLNKYLAEIDLEKLFNQQDNK